MKDYILVKSEVSKRHIETVERREAVALAEEAEGGNLVNGFERHTLKRKEFLG